MALFSFLLTFGLMAWGIGFLAFIIGPVASARIAHLHLWLLAFGLKRFAILVSEHGDLLIKRMEFSDLGVEQISLSDGTKDFEDPATALHHFKGATFALADEASGLLFDPRHAAIGARKQELERRGLGPIPASTDDWNRYDIEKWMPGVFEMPSKNELVDLSGLSAIIEGGERAEYPGRIEEIYRMSRSPFTSKESLLRIAMPIVAFLAVFGGLGLLYSQVGAPNKGSVVSFGSGLLLLAVPDVREKLKNAWARLKPHLETIHERARNALADGAADASARDWKPVLKPAGAITATIIGLVVLVGVFGVVNTILLIIMAVLGFTFLPFLGIIGRGNGLGATLGRRVFAKTGLLGYKEPVIEWTPSEYRIIDAADTELASDPTWYTLAGTKVGISYLPSEDSFGTDVVDQDRIASGSEVVTDGGETDLPTGYVANTDLKRGKYGTYVPKQSNLNRDSVYLHAGRAVSRLRNAAMGEKSLRRLLQAKEEYGEGAGIGISDTTLLLLTFAAAIIAGILGVGVFFA